MMSILIRAICTTSLLVVVLGFVSCSHTSQPPESHIVTTPGGLQYVDSVVGTGAMPDSGQTVVVNYTGRLARPDSLIFDSNVLPEFGHVQPFEFKFKVGQVIKGFDEGIATMRVGGKRRMVLPPSLGYGSRDLGSIPPNATLILDVELLGIK